MNDATPHRYTPQLANTLEATWQQRWDADGTYETPNPVGELAGDDAKGRETVCVFDMFPYPSGAGLHVGHPLGYIATDVYARYQRKLGKNVLHTLGFDAFGLPAEQFAVQTGAHPRDTTEANITIMLRQFQRLGFGHDPRRRIRTIDTDYYRWTQWIFLQLFNAWYDDTATRPDGGQGMARPIGELIEAFERGERELTGEFAGRSWSDLDSTSRAEVLGTYRLAYVDEAPVNWAPGLGTVLSNEEVTAEGRSERGNFPVFRKNLRQWKMRITAYSERLAADLDLVDWPEKIKTLQRNWIGRSVGAQVRFEATTGDHVQVFTTRPDTLFGASYLAIAPEHPLTQAFTAEQWPADTPTVWTGGHTSPVEAVGEYVRQASRKSERERQIGDDTKTGVFTGTYAINPVTGGKIPVFVADYVLMGYGTGAVMAVPAHDTRDAAFAAAFQLPNPVVVRPLQGEAPQLEAGEAFTDHGVAVGCEGPGPDINGLETQAAARAVIDWCEEHDCGHEQVTYRLRDWLFSRQRYWGEPFPIVYDADGVAHALPENMLPVELPDVPDYSPQTFEPEDDSSEPSPPLSRAHEWVNVELDLGDGVKKYRRETNTMPNWAGSCWYYLRYLDPTNAQSFCDPENENYWMGPREQAVQGAPAKARDAGGIDLYIGGTEHAVLHLLYARFWHKALYDLGHVSSAEPFRHYVAQGYIQAYAYRDHRGQPVPAAEVVEAADGTFTYNGEQVTREFGKIGKSLKNMVSPDDVCDEYGTDTFRLYEMSMGPLETSKPWETRAVVGSQRFLQRLWRNVVDEETGELIVCDDAELPTDVHKLLHQTIAEVGGDYEGLRFNTAIAKMTALNNALTKCEVVPRYAAEALVHMVAPIAPHIAEELWHRLGHRESVVYAAFPEADPAMLVADDVTCVVQVMGKVRDTFDVPTDISAAELEQAAFAREKIAALIKGKQVRKVIVKEPKLVNIVAN